MSELSNRTKPPPEKIEQLRKKLYSGEPLKLGDRLVALWFVNEIEGWPDDAVI